MSDPGSEQDLSRGVQNPSVVDLIDLDGKSGEVVLTIEETRLWSTDEQQLQQLQEKLNNYLDYVLDGYMAEDYPEYKGKSVRFELDCVAQPDTVARGFLTAFRNFAETHEIGFRVVPRESDS